MVKLAIIIPKEARAYLKQLKLTPSQKAVWYALQGFKDKNGVAWPKKETLAEESGVHVSNIRRITKQLAEFGLLTKEGKGGRNKPAHYQMLEPWAARQAPQTGAKSTPVYAQNGGETTPRFEPLSEPQKGGQSASKTGGNLPPRIELSIEQSSLKSSQDNMSMFYQSSEERKSSQRAEKISPPQPAAEAAPAAPAQLAQEPIPWDDDLPPWEREEEQQQLPPWADFPPPDEPPSPPTPPAPPEDAPPPLALVATPETAPAKPKKQKTKNNAWCDCPPDVEKSMWDAWMAIRRAKNMPMHEKTLLFTRQQAAQAGITMQRVAEICVENAWAGFKACYMVRLLNNERQTAEMEMMADKSPNESLREYYARKEVERFCPSAAAKKPQPAFDGMTIDVNAKTVNNGEQFLLEKLA